MKVIAFFGHRRIFDKCLIKERLMKTLIEVVPQGFLKLLIGCHGDFDDIALSTGMQYKKDIDHNVNISVVLTSVTYLNKDKSGYRKIDFYKNNGCETVFYDIEDVYYKNRITFSNKKMVDKSDLIICYVDMESYRSGAKTAINYAKRQNKKVINLFRKEDRILI